MHVDVEPMQCVSCYVHFGMPAGMIAKRREDGHAFYCPNGHQMSFTESDLVKMRRERDRLKQDAARLEQQNAEARQRLQRAWEDLDVEAKARKKAETEVKRQKKRAAAGVCPCCSRSFVDLARHMSSKHPGEVREAGGKIVKFVAAKA